MNNNQNADSVLRNFLNARALNLFQYILIFMVMTALTLDGLDIQLVSLLAPAILEDWGVSRASFGPAMAAALVGMIFGSSIGGWLGDRYGRKSVLVSATVCFGFATLLVGFTESVLWMTVLRFVSGLGFGAASPNSVALASEWLPDKARSRVVAVLSTGVPLGGLIGSLTLPGLLPVLGWPGCFLLFGGITLLLAFAMLFALAESPSYLFSKAKIVEAKKALSRIGEFDRSLPDVDTAVPNSEDKSRGSIFISRYTRVNIGAALCFFSVSFVAFGVLSWTPSLLTMVGFSFAEALRGLTAYNLSSVVMAVSTSFLIARFGSKSLLIVCCLASLCCLIVIGWTLAANTGNYSNADKWSIVVLVGAYGAFSGAIFATLYSLLAYAYETECRSSGVGFGMMVGRLGGITTILTGGYLLDLMDNNSVPFLSALVVATLLAIAGTWVIDRHIPKKAAVT